jgi:glycosyltransferase involved in cell wall biosynthesis
MLLPQIQVPLPEQRKPAVLHHAATQGARILFLVDEIAALTAGGTERQLLQMVDICKRGGMHPQICFMRGTKWLTEEIAGCPVTRFDIETLVSPHGLFSLARITRWVRKQRFDILQNFFSEANLVGPAIGRLARVPVVLGTRRNLNHHRQEDPNYRMLRVQSWMNLFVDQIITNSQAVMDRIIESEHVAQKRICVVYNGIDLSHMRQQPELRADMRRALGLNDDHILVGNISGLRKIKGVQMFVNAAAEAARQDPRLRFLLVGDGQLKAQLQQSIRIYGMEKIILLNGAAEDVRPYLAAFDIGVLCSHAEGFSNSLLEYMASGVPVIATDVGGNREALGCCGLLIPPETRDLANAIKIMSDPQVRNEFITAALDRVKSFDVQIASNRLMELYARYLEKADRGKRGGVQTIAHSNARPIKISGS